MRGVLARTGPSHALPQIAPEKYAVRPRSAIPGPTPETLPAFLGLLFPRTKASVALQCSPAAVSCVGYRILASGVTMSAYSEMIQADTGCTPEDAPKLEVVLRDFVVGHPLDGLTRAEFRRRAREALTLWQNEQALFTQHFQAVWSQFEHDRVSKPGHGK